MACSVWTLLHFVLAYISGLFTMMLFNTFTDCSYGTLARYASISSLSVRDEEFQSSGGVQNLQKPIVSDNQSKQDAQAPATEPASSPVSPSLQNARARIRHPGPQGLKFIHISKTGGTTVEEIGQKVRPEKVNWGMYDRPFYGYQHNRFRHLSASKRRQYDWFLIVRNPIDRFISEYHCGLEGVNYMTARHHTNKDFNDWLQVRLRKGETNGGHFIPMSDYLDPDPSVVQHIMRFENFEADLRHVLGLYNIAWNKTIPKRNNGQKRFFSRKNMSEETLAAIRYFYAGDFLNFGYPMP